MPTASSLALSVLGPVAPETIDALEETLGPLIDTALGTPRRRLDQQAWLRRQPAPSRAPEWHAPHAWHQDGGLGFDYLNNDPIAADALLPMITAWIPLMPCGRTAPGLRYDPRRRDTLIPLDALEDEARHTRPTTPALSAGEAVLMTGGLLHATAADPTMTADRISIELRWLPAHHPGRRGSEPQTVERTD